MSLSCMQHLKEKLTRGVITVSEYECSPLVSPLLPTLSVVSSPVRLWSVDVRSASTLELGHYNQIFVDWGRNQELIHGVIVGNN